MLKQIYLNLIIPPYQVQARWGNGKFYGATIKGINSDGTVKIMWEAKSKTGKNLSRCGKCNRLIPPAHFELLDRELEFGEQLRCPAHTCPCILSEAADRDGVTYRGEPVPPQEPCPICWELVCTGQYCALRVTCNCAYSDNNFSCVFKR